MMQPFECNGWWWLPDEPSRKTAGTLRFSNEEAFSLSLLGVLGDATNKAVWDVGKRFPVIWGVLADPPRFLPGHLDRDVTLKDCWVNHTTVGDRDFTREGYHAERALFGDHLQSPEDFLFSWGKIVLSGLSAWAQKKGLPYELKHDLAEEEGHSARSFQFTYRRLEPMRAEVPGAIILLQSGGRYSATAQTWAFEQKVSLTVQTDSPLAEEEWARRFVWPLTNLLTFASDNPNSLISWTASKDRSLRYRVHVVGARVYDDPGGGQELLPHKMLFTLQDVGDSFPNLIRRWLELHEQFRDACTTYFAAEYAPASYQDVQMMILMQALDLYVRARQSAGDIGDGCEIPEELINDIPPTHQERLRHWAAGLIPDTFSAALQQLYEEHRAVLRPLCRQDKDSFVAEMVAFRDHVFYRRGPIRTGDDYGFRLFLANQKLMFLMKACLLKEVGIFTSEEQQALFSRNQTYNWVSREIAQSGNP